MEEIKKYYVIFGKSIIMVPYLKNFVYEYHKWMEDPEILDLTASERLTLDEELENQHSWLTDLSKYTFLISEKTDKIQEDFKIIYKEKNNEVILSFIEKLNVFGDINLFFHNYLENNEAEIDVMIGKKEYRGKGYAKEAINIMMSFGYKFYKRNIYIAKIKTKNEASINLFTKLDFKKTKEIPIFTEIHFEKEISEPFAFNFENDIFELNLKI